MALVTTTEIARGVTSGLWHIEETAEKIVEMYPMLNTLYRQKKDNANHFRTMEMLIERALLIEMTGDDGIELKHNTSGMPVAEGYNVSISHTKGYVVLILSRDKTVGIDIEYMSDRVSRIKDRFIRTDEEAPSIPHQLILWSAKETVYKLFSHHDLRYFEMKSQPFDINDNGMMTIEVERCSTSVSVFYEINNNYVLTYAFV